MTLYPTRRTLIAGAASATAAATIAPLDLAIDVRGAVLHDQAGLGLNSGGGGIPGVLVSNGRVRSISALLEIT